MPALQAIAQLIPALVAVLGATGYVLVLGAIVVRARLRLAEFPGEVPISLASQQELIVIGAQALAIWLVLGVALAVFAAYLAFTPGVSGRLAFYGVGLGFVVTGTITGLLEVSPPLGLQILIVVLLGLAGGAVLWAVRVRPPLVAVIAVGLPAALGAGCPSRCNRWAARIPPLRRSVSGWPTCPCSG